MTGTGRVAVACLVLACATSAAAPVAAETRWISDVLLVPLRSGPTTGHRILHRGLPSGTAVEVTGAEENGYSPVRTTDGTEGWLETHYLVDEPIARVRLEAAERRIASLERQLAERARSVSELASEGQAASADRDALQAQVATLQTELAELRSISAGALATHATNQELQKLNARLRAEVETLAGDLEALEQDHGRQGMWLGAGLVLAGLLLGAVLKSRPRRSGWS